MKALGAVLILVSSAALAGGVPAGGGGGAGHASASGASHATAVSQGNAASHGGAVTGTHLGNVQARAVATTGKVKPKPESRPRPRYHLRRAGAESFANRIAELPVCTEEQRRAGKCPLREPAVNAR
jgi:hypothetical protein